MNWAEILKNKLKSSSLSEPFEEHSIVAAVLIPIGLNKATGRTEILLTKRTAHVETHKNQVGFPGGIYAIEDEKSLLSTALRETDEEIGVKRDHVEVLGQLNPVPTIFNVKIYPFVARMEFPYPYVLSEAEVARVIYLPLDDLLQHGFQPVKVQVDDYKVESIGLYCEGELIWGASAKILDDLRSLLIGK